MKNVTISLDDHLLESTREYAHQHKTSLNQLIRNLLKTVSSNPSKFWIDECFALMDKHPVSSKGKTWQREDLYGR
jgi:hypothetical protein